MEPLILNIEGMTCNHCVKSVKNSISSLSGVNNINVSLSENKVTLEYDKYTLTKEKIISAITNEGYRVLD